MPRRPRVALVALFFLTLASLVFALLSGAVAITPYEWLEILQGQPTLAAEVVWELRLPRALAGFACGALLAFAGTLMQALLRNPLADPYILGVSGGASIGALASILLGLGGLALDVFAFGGALAALLLVFGLAHGDGSWTQTRLLLTGVMVAAGCGALVTLMLAIAPEARLRGMLFWLMGDLAQTLSPFPPLIFLGVALLLALPFTRELNLLGRGAESAQTLGVNVRFLRRLVYFLAALATAAAVTSAGAIGFIGLVVPHLTRLAIGNDQRLLLPAATLLGGTLLMAADTLARTLIAPEQLPVGVLTALLGVPLFLFLLSRGKGRAP
ncbi:MAG: iron ABC transporter permease [Zoogloeaceae bacterium]|nr:iron ABC transporter permease [Zoogloeaceae bacterium]